MQKGMASTGPPSTAHRSIDQSDGCLERGVYIQIRGIEQVCVPGLAQGGNGAGFVAFVPALDIGEDLGFGDVVAGLAELAVAPQRARFGARGHEQFHIGIGTYDRADVASVNDGARRLPGEGALIGAKRFPHTWMARDDRRGFAEPALHQPRIVERGRIERLCRGKRCVGVSGLPPGCQGIARNGAVELAGVEMGKAVMRGDEPAESAFAGSRGAVDRDQHEAKFAPSRVKSGTKPGKLVPIMPTSSTVTGARAPSPRVRKAMAMR